MTSHRLALAQHAAGLPDLGATPVVFGPCAPEQLDGVGSHPFHAVQSSFVLSRALQAAGLTVTRDCPETSSGAVVVLPRAKAEALHLIGLAVACVDAQGWVVVDGQKTDGVESVMKTVAKRIGPVASYSKAHGKCFWFRATQAANLTDWQQTEMTLDTGWVTAPGVFSADGIDPASELLTEHLPALSGTVVDLGAGWGYLAGSALAACADIEVLHLVEDNAAALECARINVTDPRAQFHWTDALAWQAPTRADWVIMNPPFHVGRAASPDLGVRFITKAREILKPGGRLIMVANAHLPYDDVLAAHFHAPCVVARTSRFKVFLAEARRTATRKR